MEQRIPSIIITGASGFIGRYFLDLVKEQFRIFAIARRSASEAGIQMHHNIQWIQWDIGNPLPMQEVIQTIQSQGGADFVLHLAAFYDFDYTDNSAYHSTNINGTKNIIEIARQLHVKRFIFASSLAACNFPPKGNKVTEKSLPDADFMYAKTKKFGEEELKKSSKEFPVSVVRFAAVFSDWCEYPPVYKFLKTWLSNGYDSRILGGKGLSAVSYIHIADLSKVLLSIINKSHLLPTFDIYSASPDGCTSHKELFGIATRDYLGFPVKPIHMPKFLAGPGIVFRNILGSLGITEMPFERLWMLKYLDLQLHIDSSYTRQALHWEPSARYHITRRLLFILAKMKSNPIEWHVRNEAALEHFSFRTNLLIYEYMVAEKEQLLTTVSHHVLSLENIQTFGHYQAMELQEFRVVLSTVFHLLASSIHSGDRSLMINYMDDISLPRFAEGFNASEICELLTVLSRTITDYLLKVTDFKFTKQEIYDYVGLTIQMAQDEIEERFEGFVVQVREDSSVRKVQLKIDGIDIRVEEGTSILDAARRLNIHIPTLCYHKDLRIAGNCRVCMVESRDSKQLIASCATPAEEGMEILTNSLKVRSARKSMIELLLSEHNADCTNCYKNGKCELQALASEFKIISPTYIDLVQNREAVIDRLSPAIVKDDSKCIRCQRCVRTCEELQGVSAVDVAYKGAQMRISTFLGRSLYNVICTNCGQCIDHCPTGALVEKNYIEEVWNAIWDKNKFVIVQTAPSVRIALGEDLGIEPGKRVTGRLVTSLRRLGFDAVLDTAFSADVTTMEESAELLSRLQKVNQHPDSGGLLPMFTSCSPAWIKFIEHMYPDYLSHLSTCKSPQQMFGVLAKTYYARKTGLSPDKVVTVSVMPCTAKKFEADRPEMRASGYKDVDYVLTTRELAIMIIQAGLDFSTLPNDHFDSIMGKASGAGVIFGATGGVMEATLRTAYEKITGREIPFEHLNVMPVRGFEGIREAAIHIDQPLPEYAFLHGTDLKVAVAHGLANARTIMNLLKEGKADYHLVEIMACPGGCLGGGGQPIPTNPEIRQKRIQALYSEEMGMEIRKAHENHDVQKVYSDFLGEPLSKKSHALLHTFYKERNID
jgi:NADP-reducing hydrogenase subunit HndD